MHDRTLTFFLLSVLGGCTLSQDAETPFGGSDAGSTMEDSESSESSESSEGGETAAAPEPDAVRDVCGRLDACGFLLPGFREVDCVDNTRTCLDGGLQSEISDWELFAGNCLQFENCFNFLDCYESLETCEVPYDDVGSTSGSTGEGLSGDGTTGGAGEGGVSGDGVGEGSSSGGDDASTTNDSGGAETTDTAGESGDPPLCAGSCDACLDCALAEPCESEALACSANLDCLSLSDCYQGCEDDPCLDTCDFIFDDGVADYVALASCALDVCADSC